MMAKKICLLSAGHIASNPRLVKEADELAKHGHQVSVLSLHTSQAISRLDRILLRDRRWKSHVVTWGRIHRGLSRIWNSKRPLNEASTPLMICMQVAPWFRRYLDWIEKEKPDLLIAHTVPSLAIAILVKEKMGIPYGFDMEDYHPCESFDEYKNSIAKLVLQRGLHDAVYRTAASPFFIDASLEEFGVGNMILILNGFPRVQCSLQNPTEKKGSLSLYWMSQSIGLDRGMKDVFEAARWMPGRVRLFLRGDASEQVRAEIEHESSKSRLECCLSPQIPESQLYDDASNHDVGLVLEQKQPLNRDLCIPNKLMFYLQAGLAVAMTRTRGQNWVHAMAPGMGFIFEHGDASALASGLMRWLENPEKLIEAKRCAKAAADQMFCWEKQAPKFLQVIDQVLK